MSKNISELSGRKGLKYNLFDEMGKRAVQTGTLSEETLKELADEFLVGTATTFGASSFYDFMKPENKGKKVYVCNGTACLCAGTQERVQQKLRTVFAEEEIGHMTCLGRCHENGAFHVNGHNYSGNAVDNLKQVLNNGVDIHPDKYNVGHAGPKVLTAPFTSIPEFYAPFEAVLKRPSADALEEIKTSMIRGRGGAGFPMGLKLEFCRNTESDVKFIICNADEGDPGAYSDRYLLEERPHAVLFGMLVSGFVTRATHGIVYIRAEYPEAVMVMQEAIDDLRQNDLLGQNIKGSDFSFDIKLIKAQGAYICGEETALINSIEGQRPEVRIRPPYPAQSGLFNKPTIVNNVETQAALHFIISQGGAAWKAIGTEKSSGTKLMCLDSFFNKPGLYEVEMGTPLSKVVYELGGGFKTPVKAMQIGGPLGGLVPVHMIDRLSVDFESFRQNGFLLGHASVVCIPESFPMIKFIEHLFEFAAYESCGKCFPCRLGTKRGQEMAAMAFTGDYTMDKTLLEDLLTTLEEGSLCAHGGGIPLPVRNALKYFEEELKPYIQ